jgi:positive regulator of sigma E activity
MFKSGNSKTICHKGTVIKNESRSVLVSITSDSACSGCHAEGACSLSGTSQKVIELTGSHNVSPGDEVTVNMQESAGFSAVVLAYLLPLVVVILSLIVISLAGASELTAGLLSFAMLIPYFSVLFLLRKRISEKFSFTLNDDR